MISAFVLVGTMLAAPLAHTGHTPTGPAADTEVCTAPLGPYQRDMEQRLGLVVDGRQSADDCRAIRSFQREQGVTPAEGYADLMTHRTAVAVEARADPNAEGNCPVRSYRVTCIDLDRQLLWVQRSGTVEFDPVPIRSGRDGQETRPGWHEIYERIRDHASTIYDNAPMPYSQFFDGGQALHGRPDSLYDGGGSAGCVNLTLPHAAALWDVLEIGDSLYVWGAKPGTDD